MSYLTATNMHHGPPGPLDVLSGNEGAATNYRGKGQCPCSAVGADAPVREGSLFNGIAITAAIVGGLFYLMRKTRKR